MPSFQCPKCELVFAAQGELDWHLREEHREDQPRTQSAMLQRPDQAGGNTGPAAGTGTGDPTRRPRWWSRRRRSA